MTVQLRVEVYNGPNHLRTERFDREIIKIGRLASAHLKLDDPRVARIHAVIEAASDGRGFAIIDMGSTDGTFVNGARISKEVLSDGDEIVVGGCRLLVRMGEAEAEAAIAVDPAEIVSVRAASEPAGVRPAALFENRELTGPADDGAEPLRPASFAKGNLADESTAQSTFAELSRGSLGPSPILAQASPAARTSAVESPSRESVAPVASLPPGARVGAWGAAPNNLASQSVPDTERVLEVKTIWADAVLDTFSVYDQPVVTMGDEARTTGWGPLARYLGCDIDLPAKHLPRRAWPLAIRQSAEGCSYALNVHSSFGARVERADGRVLGLEEITKRGERSDIADTWRVPLLPEDTLYLQHGDVTLQLRYVRRAKFVPPGFLARANFTYLNILILAFFFHVLAIASFVSMPQMTEDLTDSLFKNPNRFRQFEFVQKQTEERVKNDMLANLKAGETGAKHRGKEGKAGRKDSRDKDKRLAVKGDPNDREIAKSTLAKLFGTGANGRSSQIFGTGGLGGELTGALGGVTGAEVGDAQGLGGLGTRGSGPGGGGLSMSSVGIGALGTHGRGGGGDGSYGSGVGNLGRKTERDIDISAGTPIIRGSLDKEIIRRVIKSHIAQIRYCYEKELIRSPGLFGKVNMEWVIEGSGVVKATRVVQSTLENDEVERCLGGKIRTWQFPKPKGGGIVIVRYPFVFKRTG